MSLANTILVVKSFKEHKGRKGKVGGSLPKGAPSYEQDSPYAQSTPPIIQEFEHANYDLPQEHLLIVRADGNTIHLDGSSSGVDIPTSFLENSAGGILTHNHPIYGQRGKNKGLVITVPGFSPNDLQIFIEHGLKEMRAVDEHYVYVMKNENAKPSGKSVVHYLVGGSYNLARTKWTTRARAKQVSWDAANANICLDFGNRVASRTGSTFTIYDRKTGAVVNEINADTYYKPKSNTVG